MRTLRKRLTHIHFFSHSISPRHDEIGTKLHWRQTKFGNSELVHLSQLLLVMQRNALIFTTSLWLFRKSISPSRIQTLSDSCFDDLVETAPGVLTGGGDVDGLVTVPGRPLALICWKSNNSFETLPINLLQMMVYFITLNCFKLFWSNESEWISITENLFQTKE